MIMLVVVGRGEVTVETFKTMGYYNTSHCTEQ